MIEAIAPTSIASVTRVLARDHLDASFAALSDATRSGRDVATMKTERLASVGAAAS